MNDEPLNASDSGRQAKLFLRLCDMRRAVIGTNAVMLLFTISEMINLFLTSRKNVKQGANDAYMREFYTNMAKQNLHSAFWCMLPLLTHVGAIVGAIKFNWMLVVPQAMYGCYMAVSFFFESAIHYVTFRHFMFGYAFYQLIYFGILCVVSAYPNVMFLYQSNKGVLTEDTYHRERFSVCCLDLDQRGSEDAGDTESASNKDQSLV